MAGSWKLTIRSGPQVQGERFPALPEAIDALGERLSALAPSARRGTAKVLVLDVAPEEQVAVRGQVAGPGRLLASVVGGVDLRGDGSAQAWTGRVSRKPVLTGDLAGAVAALRRTLDA